MKAEEFQRLLQYLSIMHDKALEIYSELRETEKNYITEFLGWRYAAQRDRVWSIKKLFALAMFLPLFLQIGKRYFNKVIYIDTHAGPGIAKVGRDESDLVLGSPLIALLWPAIVASRVNIFSKIAGGFDKLVFIEKYKYIATVLKIIINNLDIEEDKVLIKNADSNLILNRGRDWTSHNVTEEESCLFLLFIDPLGSIDSQLKYQPLERFVNDHQKVDLIINVQSGLLARALSGINNPQRYRAVVRELFGNNCRFPDTLNLSICRKLRNVHINVRREDLVKLYTSILRSRWGYVQVFNLPIEYREGSELYHLVFATRSPGRKGNWLLQYEEYLCEILPRSYDHFKNIWGIARGRFKALL